MGNEITTTEEGVACVYKKGELIAIVKRDDVSKKHLVYVVEEGTTPDIIDIIKGNVSTQVDYQINDQK